MSSKKKACRVFYFRHDPQYEPMSAIQRLSQKKKLGTEKHESHGGYDMTRARAHMNLLLIGWACTTQHSPLAILVSEHTLKVELHWFARLLVGQLDLNN